MSKLVDERVVEMKFDNKNFEKNTRQSMSTIEKLKASLNFDGMSSSINKSINSVDMNPITYGLEKTSKAFSAWEVAAITAISNITNRIVNLGVEMVKNLSVDNIAAGWQKFEESTKSIGTLVMQGNDMKDVEDQMELLMWYADQTSYSYTDMVENISKFTATGQSLEDSVQAMMGIANWAAASGQNATVASRAMYQLSQAMGIGAVKYQDWKSIQNASMDTQAFRQAALDTAVAMGKLTKGAERFDGTIEYMTKNGNLFTKSEFTKFLSEDEWLSSDVLMETLKKYSSAVNEIKEITDKNPDLTPNEAMEMYANDTKRYEEELESYRKSLQNLEEGFTEEGLAALEAKVQNRQFALSVFQSAQEARTLTDAIVATKDAVSSQWLKFYNQVFGNYEEATELWTEMANRLYDIFAAPLEKKNKVLKEWRGYTDEVLDLQENYKKQEEKLEEKKKSLKDSGMSEANIAEAVKAEEEALKELQTRIDTLRAAGDHRSDIFGLDPDNLGAFWNVADAIKKVIDVISTAFSEVFKVNKSLGEITRSLQTFTKKLVMTGGVANYVKYVFKGIFSVFKLGIKIVQGVLKAIQPVFKAIFGASGGLLKFLGNLGEKFSNFVDTTTIFTTIGEKIGNVFSTIIETFRELDIITKVTGFFKDLYEQIKASETVNKTLGKLKETLNSLFDLFIAGIKNVVSFTTKYLVPLFVTLIKYTGYLVGAIGKFVFKGLQLLADGIKYLADKIRNSEQIQNGWKKFVEFIQSIPDRLKKVTPFLNKLGDSIKSFFIYIWNGIKTIGSGMSKIVNLESLGEMFSSIGHHIAEGFSAIVEGVRNLTKSKIGSQIDGVERELTPLETLLKGIIDVFKGIFEVFKALATVIGRILSSIGGLFSSIADSLKKTFNQNLLQGGAGINLWYLINGGVVMLILKGIYDFVYLFKNVTAAITDAVYSIGSVLRAKAAREWAAAIKEIAISMLMLVGSLLILTLIDEGRLMKAAKVLVGVMAALALIVGIMAQFLKTTYKQSLKFPKIAGKKGKMAMSGGSFSSEGSGFSGAAMLILSFAVSTLILVKALKTIDSINSDKLLKDIAVLGVIMAGLTISIGMMNRLANMGNKTGESAKGLKGVLEFALGVCIISIPLQKFGEMDGKVILKGLTTISAILLAYAVAVRIMNGVKSKGMAKFTTFALALNALAAPVQTLGSLDIGSIGKALLVIGALTLVYAALIDMSKDMKLSSAFGALLIISSFGLIVWSVAELIQGPLSNVSVTGLVAFGIIATALIVFVGVVLHGLSTISKKASEVKSNKNVLKALATMAVTLYAIVGSLYLILRISKVMETVSWESVAKIGVITIGLMAIVVGIIQYAKHITKDSASFSTLIKNLAIFAGVVHTIITTLAALTLLAKLSESIPWESIGKLFTMLAGMILSAVLIIGIAKLIKADAKLEKSIIMVTSIMESLAIMMLGLAVVANLCKSIGLKEMGKMLLILAGALATVFVVVFLASKFKKQIEDVAESLAELAGAFALFGVAAMLMAVGIQMLGKNVKGLIIFAAVVVVMAVAMKLLGSAAPTMMMVAVAFALIGISALAVGAAFYLITLALKELLPIIDELAEKSESLETIVESTIQGALEGVANAIPTIVSKILEGLDLIIENVFNKIKAFIEWFKKLDLKDVKDLIDKVFELAFLIILESLRKLKENTKEITKELIGIINAIINGVKESLPDIMSTMAEFMIAFINAVGETMVKYAEDLRNAIIKLKENIWTAIKKFFGIEEAVDKVKNFVSTLMSNLVAGLQAGWNVIAKFFSQMGTSIWKTITGWAKQAVSWGQNLIQGFKRGIQNVWNGFVNFWKNLWDGIVNWFKNLFGIHSPSKLFYDFGEYTVEGYQNGLDAGEDGVYDSFDDLSSAAENVFGESDTDSLLYNYGKQIDQRLAEALIFNSGIVYDALNQIITKSINLLTSSSDKFNEAISGLIDVINSNIADDDALVITPIMDLSDIENGTGLIAAMLSSVSGVTVAKASVDADKISEQMQQTKNSQANDGQLPAQTSTMSDQNGVYNVTFNITGNDPKAIADEVSKRFQQEIDRRGLKYGYNKV